MVAVVAVRLAGDVGLDAGADAGSGGGSQRSGSALGPLGRVALAYLIVERSRPVDRHELAEVLWGEQLPATWDASLRALVSRLRAMLSRVGLPGGEALTTAFGCYQLHLPPGTVVDVEAAAAGVEEAERGIAEGRFAAAREAAAEAVKVARQRFVPGAGGQWVERRQSELHELHLRSLEVLADASVALGEPSPALAAADEAVALEPFRESAHLRLMRAHAAAGNRPAALRAYERCRRLLAEELGVPPSPQTEAAYISLLGPEPVAGPGPTPPIRTSDAHIPTSPAATAAAPTSAAGGSDDGRGPAVTDPFADASPAPTEPGSGPMLATRPWPLVGRDGELAAVAEALGAPGAAGIVLVGAPGIGKTRLAREAMAMAEAGGRYPVWVAGLKATSSIPLGAFARLAIPPDVASNQRELLGHAAGALMAQAGDRPLVLGVDDAHHLDDTSAALVNHLAVAGSAFVVLAIRGGEPVPDPIVALWKDDLARRIDLGALTQSSTADLLYRVLDGFIDAPTFQELWAASGGNVMILRELVLAGIERGALGREHGTWRWRGRLPGGRRLTDAVEARLGVLDAGPRRVLETVSIGEVVSPSVLEDLAPPEVVAELVARGIVGVDVDGRRTYVRLAHPFYGDVLREGAGLLAKGIQRRLADGLEATGARRRGDLLRLATWRLESDGRVAADLALRAARQAGALFDHRLGERLARASLDSGGGSAARLALGQALAGQGRGEEAEQTMAAVAAVATDEGEIVRIALARSSNLLTRLAQPTAAEQVLVTARAAVADDARTDELAVMQAEIMLFTGRVDEGLAILEPVIDRPRAHDAVVVHALTNAVLIWSFQGRSARALEGAERGIRLAARGGDEMRSAEARLQFMRWQVLLQLGRLDEADAMGDQYRRAMARREYDAAALFSICHGQTALMQGRVRTARRRLTEALSIVQEQNSWGMGAFGTSMLATAAGMAGDAEAARLAADDAGRLDRVNEMSVGVFAGRAWAAAAAGDLASAQELAIRGADQARRTGQPLAEVVALHGAVRMGAFHVAERLADVAAATDPGMAAAYAAHALAVAADDGPALDAAASRFAAMGALLLAAEAAAEAYDSHRRRGPADAAEASRVRAEALLARCEGARTPPLALLTREPA